MALTPLTGQTIAATYKRLLITEDTNGISGTLTRVQDGLADPLSPTRGTSLYLSTAAAEVDGTLGVSGNFAVATNKFTVAATTGNSVIAGTLNLAGNFAIATNKFNVTAASGNTTIAGTLNASGNVFFGSDLQVFGNLSAGSFVITNLVVGGTAAITGDFAVNTNRFTVNATTGDTAVLGTLTIGGIAAVVTTDSRLSDARTPVSHASTHQHGGSDEVATATAAANAIPKADGTGKLSVNWIPSHKSTHAIAGSDFLSPADIGAANVVHTHVPADVIGLNLGFALDYAHGVTTPLVGGNVYYFGDAADLAANPTITNRLFTVPYNFQVIGASITITNTGTFAVGTNNESYKVWNATNNVNLGTIYAGSGVNNHNQTCVTINTTGLNFTFDSTKSYSIAWDFGSGFSTGPTAIRTAVVLYCKLPYGSFV